MEERRDEILRLGWSHMKRAERALQEAYAKGPWTQASGRKRILWASILIIWFSLLLLLVAVLINQPAGWIAFGFTWALVCLFLVGVAINPSQGIHLYVRVLFIVLILGIVASLTLGAVVFIARCCPD